MSKESPIKWMSSDHWNNKKIFIFFQRPKEIKVLDSNFNMLTNLDLTIIGIKLVVIVFLIKEE